jgi:hypothetical protein
MGPNREGSEKVGQTSTSQAPEKHWRKRHVGLMRGPTAQVKKNNIVYFFFVVV